MAFDGLDYHQKIGKELTDFIEEAKKLNPKLEMDYSLDIHPVLERDLAMRSGLGWFSKSSMLINKNYGSYFMIGSIFFSEQLHLQVREKSTNHCGSCTKCLDACPTRAITQDSDFIAGNCVSTFTIEQFKEVEAPSGFRNAENHIFGCDICLDVCPWNQKMMKEFDTTESLYDVGTEKQKFIMDFFLRRPIREVSAELEGMSNREYKRLFKDTSLERTGRVGILKNIKSLL